MKKILCLNKISPAGLELIPRGEYEYSDECASPDGILVRSASMHEFALAESLQAIARAGAGVNNIPLERCTERGICVFNTPGANARGVCELVICGLLLASRDVIGGVAWANSLTENVAKTVEKGKGNFAGCEIFGKTLGVIGLGAIGLLVAEAASALGMKVVGYDPYISDARREALGTTCSVLDTMDEVYAAADYLTVHIPCTADTRGMLSDTAFMHMKKGVKLLNFSRAELVDACALKMAIAEGIVAKYVTDFPTEEILCVPGVVAIPHLGASTEESEDRCAEMAVLEMCDYIENGNVKNSVNFPNVSFERSAGTVRLCVLFASDMPISELMGQVSGKVITTASGQRGNISYAIFEGEGLFLESNDARIIKILRK